VSQAWSYKWRRGDGSPRRARRDRLKAEIARLFEAHQGKRGSPMIIADLTDAGWAVSKNTVAALIAEMGLAARRKSWHVTRAAGGQQAVQDGTADPAGVAWI
jgi:putative transposase